MKLVTNIAKMQELGFQTRSAGLTLGLVPTMGALHEGHLELVRRARSLCDVVVVSIFVNPTQFNNVEDFAAYPTDIDRDRRLLVAEGVEILFAPAAEDVYPEPGSTTLKVDGLGERLCGPGRPGHFEGVATVVAALLHMVGPDLAVFGEKDYQQLQVVCRMVRDLHFPVRIVGVPTVREQDGLAMSSRNRRLSVAERAVAPAVHAALSSAGQAYVAGETDAETVKAVATKLLVAYPEFEVEYLDLVDGVTLEPVARVDADCVLAVAVKLGPVRLIDNILFARVSAGGKTQGPVAREFSKNPEAETASSTGVNHHA